jgi:hypothetical protein
MQHEVLDVINATLSAGQDSNAMDKSPVKVKYSPTVSMSGKTIFKSTLMNELNGNPFLSKDRLTRIRNFVYFNNAKDYMTVVWLDWAPIVVFFLLTLQQGMLDPQQELPERGQRVQEMEHPRKIPRLQSRANGGLAGSRRYAEGIKVDGKYAETLSIYWTDLQQVASKSSFSLIGSPKLARI